MEKLLSKKFRAKIFLLLLVAFFIPVFGFVFLNYLDTQNYEELISNKIAENNSESQKEVFEYWIRIKEENLLALGEFFEDYIDEYGIDQKINKTLDEMILMDDEILNTFFTTTDGENFLSGGISPVVQGKDRVWYKKAIDEEIGITEPYEDAVTGKFVVTFSKVIKDDSRNVIGVLGVDVLFSRIIDKFFRVFDESIVNIIFVNDESEIIYSSDKISDDYVNKLLENKDSGRFNKNLISIKRIESIEVDLILITNNIKSFSDLSGHKEIAFLVVLVILAILSFFLILRGTLVIYDPIRKLEKNAVNLVENSNFDVEFLGYEDLDGILELFIEMNEFINKNESSIEIMRIDLDDRNKTLIRLNKEYEKAYLELEKFSSELSHKEREYENLVENIVDYIWIIDLDGKISYLNDRLLSKLGYEDFELLGTSFSQIIPEFKNDFGLHKILLTRDYDSIDIKFISKNGTEIILTSTKTKRIYRENEIVSVQGISRDITLEKTMQDELNVKNSDLLLINKISKEMANTDNLKNILNLILKEINNLIGIKVSTIRILNEKDSLKLEAFRGDEKFLMFPDESKEALNSHLGVSIKNNRIVLINGIEDIIENRDYKIIESVKEGNKFLIVPLITDKKPIGILSIVTESFINERVESLLVALANSAAVSIEKALLYEKLQVNYLKTIKALITAMEAKNFSMQGHSNRVALLSKLIAKKLYLNESEIRNIHLAALLHDIGKIGIKDNIIKNSKFDKNGTQKLIGMHVDIGKKILEPIKLDKIILDGVYYHHKGYDGTGYPKDDVKTPLSGLIIGISDELDSLLNQNFNKPTESIKKYLLEQSGKKFSPEMVNIIIELIDNDDDEFKDILSPKSIF